MVRFAVIALGVALACSSGALAQTLPGPPPPAAPNGATAAAPSSIYAAVTVKDFLAICSNDAGGCADKVGMALNDKMVMDGSANICLPGPDYASSAISWLKAHPETGGMETEDGIYLALRKAYPCG